MGKYCYIHEAQLQNVLFIAVLLTAEQAISLPQNGQWYCNSAELSGFGDLGVACCL